MIASKTKNNEANLKKGQYFQFIVSKISKIKPLSDVDDKENLRRLNSIRNEINKDVKKLKPISVITKSKRPFEIPKNWFWLTIKDVVKLTENYNIQDNLKPECIVNYVDISCIDNNEFKIKEIKELPVSELSSRARRVLKKDYFLYSLVRPYLNNMAIVNEQKELMIASTGFSVFDSFYLKNDFLKYWFLSPFIKDFYNDMISGFNSPSISMNQFLDTPVPIAPIEEQKAIISFFKSLELNQNEDCISLPKELISDIIKLDKLQKISTSLFENIGNRILLIPKLKQSILQEAIQGKLTADWRKQNPNTESSNTLFERIKAEKDQLIKDKKIKKEKALPPITEEEIPFELPDGWVWCRFVDIAEIARGGSPRPIGNFLTNDEDGINWIKIGDTKNDDKFINSTREKIKPEGLKKSRFVEPGDFLLTNSMSFGRPYIMKTSGCIHDGWLLIRYAKKFIEQDYLYSMLSSKYVYDSFKETARGGVVQNLNIDKARATIIPIPPLSEQQAIIEKVESLMEKCQTLEKEIITSEANAKMLMQAVLKEAFEGKQEVVEV